jgi:hypothetical protein
MRTALVLAVLVALSAVLIFWVERRRFARFWSRSCTGRAWKGSFPEASAQEIREFLDLFVRAFAFGQSRKLQFEPGDRVLVIYRTRYLSRLNPDMMELETLVKLVKKRFGVDITPAWHEEITLGEVFQRATKRAA